MKIYVGIDVAKRHLDLHYLDQPHRITNTEKAIRGWLKGLPPEAVLICESSGGYESTLLAVAHATGRPIIRVNARQAHDFAKAKGLLAKTDRIDARMLSDFARVFESDPLVPPDPLQQELGALVKYRAHLLAQITQNRNLTETVSDQKLLAYIAKTVAFLQKQVKQVQDLIAEKIRQSWVRCVDFVDVTSPNIYGFLGNWLEKSGALPKGTLILVGVRNEAFENVSSVFYALCRVKTG